MKILWDLKILWETGARRAKILWDFVSQCEVWHVWKMLMSVHWLCWGLMTHQPLWVILCRLPEKGTKEREEVVEEMKERDREERGK